MSIFGDLFIFSPRVIQDNAGFERRDGRKIVSRIGEIAQVVIKAGYGKHLMLVRDGVEYALSPGAKCRALKAEGDVDVPEATERWDGWIEFGQKPEVSNVTTQSRNH